MITRQRAYQLRAIIEHMAEDLTDETALDYKELYPLWLTDHAYSIGDRVRYNDTLYKCVQAHTSQTDWTPDITPALWTVVSIDEWPEWRQPTGAQDAYSFGDKVSYDGRHWISEYDNNVWRPTDFGWSEA